MSWYQIYQFFLEDCPLRESRETRASIMNIQAMIMSFTDLVSSCRSPDSIPTTIKKFS